MTRINVVPVQELCDQHLLAEARELPRIPNYVIKKDFDVNTIDGDYRLGEGHVKFFYDKLLYLFLRYQDIICECARRGFTVQYRWPISGFTDDLWNDYTPTQSALQINRDRLEEKMSGFEPRYTEYK